MLLALAALLLAQEAAPPPAPAAAQDQWVDMSSFGPDVTVMEHRDYGPQGNEKETAKAEPARPADQTPGMAGPPQAAAPPDKAAPPRSAGPAQGRQGHDQQ